MTDERMRRGLDALFAPRSVVVIGASTDPTKLSGRPLPNLLRSDFDGDVYVVHPRAEEIEGVRCHRSVADIGAPVDAAIIVLPPDAAVGAAEECAAAGVAACIVGVSGFAEEGTPEGAARQQRLSELSAEHGMIVIGPNTNGVYNGTLGIPLGYNSAHAEDFEPGGFSIVSHSGALFSVLAGRMRELGVGLGKFVSVGNESDLTLLDYTEYLLDDDATRVIGLMVEAIDDGERFRHIARRAAELGKSIVALKLGQTDDGARATSAHSSRLAGSTRSYDAVFTDSGVAAVTTVEGMIAAARLLLTETAVAPGSGALAGVTASGAASSLLADGAVRRGVPIATLTAATIAALEELPCTAPVVNPVDIGAIGGPARIREVFRAVATDPGVSAVLVYAHVLQTQGTRMLLADSVREARDTSGKLHIVVAPGHLTDDEEAEYAAAGIPLFHDSAAAFEGLGALFRAAPAPIPAPDAAVVDVPQRRVLTELESARLLAAFDVPVVDSVECSTSDEAVAAAERLGYPVVLKGVVPGIEHKSDLGLVQLELTDGAAVREAYARISDVVAGIRATGTVAVQPMSSSRLEAIVGMTTEPGLGRFLIAGLGGVYAEALDDAAVIPVPSDRDAIARAVRASALGRVLESPRWTDAAGMTRVVDALLGVQRLALAAGNRIAAVDVNPLAVDYGRVLALDALVVTTAQDGENPP